MLVIVDIYGLHPIDERADCGLCVWQRSDICTTCMRCSIVDISPLRECHECIGVCFVKVFYRGWKREEYLVRVLSDKMPIHRVWDL